MCCTDFTEPSQPGSPAHTCVVFSGYCTLSYTIPYISQRISNFTIVTDNHFSPFLQTTVKMVIGWWALQKPCDSVINREGCPVCSPLDEWLAVRFHRPGLSLRGTAAEADSLRAAGVEGEQERGGAERRTQGRFFMTSIWEGHYITCIVILAEWKNRNGMGPAHRVQRNREVKRRVQQSRWWLGFLWLMWPLQAASLIKLWILWSDQLSKLHLPAVCFRPVHLIIVSVPCFVSPALGSASWHRQGLRR